MHEGRRRVIRKTLCNTRIYERKGWLAYFAPEPIVCKKTGRMKRWHKLARIGPGDELAARNALEKLLSKTPGNGDFPIYFDKWRAEFMVERKDKAPHDPVRLMTWDTSTKGVDSQFSTIEHGFAQLNVADIKPFHVNAFLKQWYGRRSAQTYRTYLERFFAWSAGQGLREDNPATSDVVVIKQPKKRFVTISAEQFNSVRDALATNPKRKTEKLRKVRGGEMMQCYLDLNYLMGQRNADVRIMRHSDIDSGKSRIRVKPGKTENTSGLDVFIPITPEIQTVLDKLKTISRMDSMFLLHTPDGQPYTASGLNANFKRAMARAGLSGFTVKDIRSMSLTDASMAGYSDEELKVTAAHTSIETTRGYVKERNTPTSVVHMKMPKAASK